MFGPHNRAYCVNAQAARNEIAKESDSDNMDSHCCHIGHHHKDTTMQCIHLDELERRSILRGKST